MRHAGGEIAETGTMFGGGWGRLAARGEGSGGGDGGVALGLSPYLLSLELHTLVFFFASYIAGKATRTQGALRREGGPDCVLCRTAETLADPYKGKTPLPRVPNYQEPFASRHPNTWNARANQYLEQSPETHNHRMHSFPPIATE
jgi:hypothetical protein